MAKQMVNIADVYDINALKKIHPGLSFLQAVDKRSGYRAEQMLVAPVMNGKALFGVLYVIYNRADQPFTRLEEDGAQQLCNTLGIAIRQRMQKLNDSQRKKATKYDGLVEDGVLSQQELTDCIQKAREHAETVEHLLMADHQIRPALLGPSLAKFFGVGYEPFNVGRIRSEMLHGPLKREFIGQQGWIPLEETSEGLVIMCVDPEAVRGSRVLPLVFPRKSRFAYSVTT